MAPLFSAENSSGWSAVEAEARVRRPAPRRGRRSPARCVWLWVPCTQVLVTRHCELGAVGLGGERLARPQQELDVNAVVDGGRGRGHGRCSSDRAGPSAGRRPSQARPAGPAAHCRRTARRLHAARSCGCVRRSGARAAAWPQAARCWTASPSERCARQCGRRRAARSPRAHVDRRAHRRRHRAGPLGGTDGKSGSTLERVVIDGERFVLKHLHPDDDWTMRGFGDLGCRPVEVWTSGLLDAVPPTIDHAVVGAAAGPRPQRLGRRAAAARRQRAPRPRGRHPAVAGGPPSAARPPRRPVGHLLGRRRARRTCCRSRAGGARSDRAGWRPRSSLGWPDAGAAHRARRLGALRRAGAGRRARADRRPAPRHRSARAGRAPDAAHVPARRLEARQPRRRARPHRAPRLDLPRHRPDRPRPGVVPVAQPGPAA